MSVTAENLLRTAAETLKERATTRDLESERSMKKTVELFNKLHGTELTEIEGWSFMMLLKMVRANAGKLNPDDYIDLIGYGALLAESAVENANNT